MDDKDMTLVTPVVNPGHQVTSPVLRYARRAASMSPALDAASLVLKAAVMDPDKAPRALGIKALPVMGIPVSVAF
jgi:hypothetical protein